MAGWGSDIGWRGKVGLITTPIIDNTHIELMRIAPDGVAAYQTVPHVENFKVRSDYIIKASEQLEQCARALSSGGVDVIGQAGTPFSFAHPDGLPWARRMHARLEDASQKPVTMMGLSILEALEFYGFSRVAVASTYYTQEICDRYTAFLTSAGFKVETMQNWIHQGLLHDEKAMERSCYWYPHSLAYQAARKVAAQAPDSDCILLTGGSIHTMDMIQALEADLGKPVITSDSAFFWSILRKLGIRERLEGWGDLLRRLPDS